ncbi:hypothetical protein K456DRAFT_1718315 [Colletotrichum gloeosporioides 23]|nr:hypothetical protein K456DRAFT_1718315 [Colletotrichum gloeosporioides 23]KAJ0290416.1 hypothetical protein COL940_000934 [Colletotrichum noveboracense]KAJ0294850.1 hypothetical protein CBS470a_000356 [Colletotrichum nupharicola]KAJ0324063.1 hypothetical protein Brms1b_001310 [Colletotrichum noveboracense]
MAPTSAPPAEEIQRPLAGSIAAATRSVHAKLNKLIIARLPLAIPPLSADPSIYVSGLLHIAPIYIAFESVWKDIVDSVPVESRDGGNVLDELLRVPHDEPGSIHNVNASKNMRSILKSLYLPELMRSDRLRSDIGFLTGWSPEMVDEQLKTVSNSGRLAEFTRHAKRTIEKKPHTVLSYSYILFMALFAGGRFIRATLESAGSDFWEQVPSPIPPLGTICQPRQPKEIDPLGAIPTRPIDLLRGESGTLEIGAKHARHTLPLSFFHFATVLDGEDLKKEFKKRLAESEAQFTPRERHDIIQEAICIFDNMLLLVSQLDNVCDTRLDDVAGMGSWAPLGSGHRLRDSVVVARERRAQASERESGDGERSNTWLCKHARQQKSEMGEIFGAGNLEGYAPAGCPASGSMKFDAKLPIPDRKGTGKTPSTHGAATSQSPMAKSSTGSRSSTTLFTNIVLVAVLAAIVGIYFFATRPVDKGLPVDGGEMAL